MNTGNSGRHSVSRRLYLRTVGTGSLVGLAGCGSTGNGSEQPTGTESPIDTPADVITPRDPAIDPPNNPDPLDPGELQTYQNDQYGYSIKYPGNWNIDESRGNPVLIIAPDDQALLQVGKIQPDEPIESWDEYIQSVIDQLEEVEGVEVLGNETVSLPSNREGVIIDTELRETESTYLHKALYVQLGADLVHLAEVFALEELYTNEFDQLAREILTSLIIFE